MKTVTCIVLITAASACGATRPPVATSTLPANETQRLRTLVPDMWTEAQLAERSSQQARDNGDEQTAELDATRTRMLVHAATLEAQRIEFARERQQVEQETATLGAQAEQDEARRVELDQRLELARASELARQQIARAMSAARDFESRRSSHQSNRELRAMADALIAHAQALVTQARAARTNEEVLLNLQARINAARRNTSPRARLQQAAHAADLAEALFAQLSGEIDHDSHSDAPRQ